MAAKKGKKPMKVANGGVAKKIPCKKKTKKSTKKT